MPKLLHIFETQEMPFTLQSTKRSAELVLVHLVINLVHSSSLYVMKVDADESQIGGRSTHHFMSWTMNRLSVELS